jgi:hypothetical protein
MHMMIPRSSSRPADLRWSTIQGLSNLKSGAKISVDPVRNPYPKAAKNITLQLGDVRPNFKNLVASISLEVEIGI